MMNEKIMREILFRGKRVDNGEWVEGYYFKGDNHNFIVPVRSKGSYSINDNTVSIDPCYNVIPETVGQYTGLTDKNGKKIFEGDIFSFHDFCGNIYYGVVKFGNYFLSDGSHIGFYVDWLDDTGFYRSDLGCWADKPYTDIVGNIHDNPELLKGVVKE